MRQLRKGQIGQTLARYQKELLEILERHFFLGARSEKQLRRRLLDPRHLVQLRIAAVPQPQFLCQDIGARHQMRQQINLLSRRGRNERRKQPQFSRIHQALITILRLLVESCDITETAVELVSLQPLLPQLGVIDPEILSLHLD